jgi:YD repeat-containing protein
MTDPNQNLTKYGFSDNYVSTNTGGYTTTAGSPPSGEVTNAFLTKITNALQQTSAFTYGYNDGELTTVTDPNSQLIIYRYNDNFDRPTETDYPDGGQKMIAYVDSSPVSVTTCSLISGTAGATCSATSPPSGWKTTEEIEDG